MLRTNHAIAPQIAAGDADTTWVVRPALKAAIAITAVAAMVFPCALIVFSSVRLAVLSVLLIGIVTLDKLLPATYRLDSRGASVSFGPVTWLEMSWRDVRSVVCTSRGLKLSAFDNPATALMEHSRGIELIYAPSLSPRIEQAVALLRASAGTEDLP